MTLGPQTGLIIATPLCIETESTQLNYNASEPRATFIRCKCPNSASVEPNAKEGILRTEFDSGFLEDRQAFISSFADHINARVVHGDHQKSFSRGDRPTIFFGRRNAAIPVKEYVKRIALHSKCSPVCFISAYAYLQRLGEKGKEHKLCSQSVHRLLITSILIATKLMDDKFYSNAYYARIGGVSTRELNGLELEMLKLLEFRAFVSCSELSRLLKIVRGGYEPELAAQADALGSSTCRRSKKRVGDEVGSLDNNLPAKLQHDSQSSQILVTKESSQAEIGPPHVSGLGKPAVTVLACQQEILRLPMQSGTPVQLHIAITAGGD